MKDTYKRNIVSLSSIFLLTAAFLFIVNILISRANDENKEDGPAQVTRHNPPLRREIYYGNASWYGTKFHGKKTSNGERFSKYKLTAAHRTLPFNTKVLVTNLKNNKSVIVRINDRGPFVGNRIIDLSEKAASMIGTKKEGTAYIKLQVLNNTQEN